MAMRNAVIHDLHEPELSAPPRRQDEVIDISDLGEVTMVALNKGSLSALQPFIIGYPGDKPFGQMWGMQGPLTDVGEDLLLYKKISTYAGQSGSSLLYKNLQNLWCTVGVHIGG